MKITILQVIIRKIKRITNQELRIKIKRLPLLHFLNINKLITIKE